MLCSLFWLIPRPPNLKCRRFGIIIYINYTNTTTYEDGTQYSETSTHKIETPGNHPKEGIEQFLHLSPLHSIPAVSMSRSQWLLSLSCGSVAAGNAGVAGSNPAAGTGL